MTRLSLLLVTALAATVACSKPEPPAPSPEPAPPPTVAISASPAAPTAPAIATATATSSASPAQEKPANAASTTTTAAVASAPAPARDAGKTPAAVEPPLRPARARVDGKNFALDVVSPGCRAGDECTLTLRLTAAGEFHVNKEYPYKFSASPAAGLTFLGKGEPTVFSRASGDFREDGEKSATMTVRFRAASAGEAKVSGVYKMSVCSAEACQIESPRVELVVPVL